MRKIEVVSHQAEWATQFQKETTVIAAMLNETLIRSFHIGSTAVPNLRAKPIIDILLVVEKIELVDFFQRSLKL